jgi:predicted MFS family arabinose efflux permease
VVYALALLAGITAPATNVGLGVLLPRLVPDHDLGAANALVSLGQQLSQFAGPVAAGLCVAVVGGPTVLLIDAASFLVMTAVLWGLPDTPAPPPRARNSPRSWLGFGTLLRHPNIRVVTLMSAVFFLAYWPTEPALPLYSRVTLQAGAGGYGLLLSAFGAGALVGLLAIPWVSRLPRPGIALAAIAVLWGLLLFPLTFLHALAPAAIFLAVAGASWAPYSATELTLLQRLAPPHQRGEILGAQASLVTATGPLGIMLGGILLVRLSAAQVIGISAAACILAGAAGLLSPTLRSIRRIAGDAAPAGEDRAGSLVSDRA